MGNKQTTKSKAIKRPKSEAQNFGLDLNIFKSEETSNKCFGDNKDETKIEIQDCEALNRLVNALKYYTLLNITNTESSHTLFAEFCDNIYKNALNDFIHFMTTHSAQIEGIHKSIVNHQNFGVCNLSKCNMFNRHYTNDRRQKQTMVEKTDSKSIFYSDLFDRFHHFIYHLFDVGLRIPKSEIMTDTEQKQTDNNDFVFAKQQKIISQKREQRNIDRFEDKTNAKYNMSIQKTTNNNNVSINGQTMTDVILQKIENKFGKNTKESLANLIISEEFDSDAIVADITQMKPEQTNLLSALKNSAKIAYFMNKFIEISKLSQQSFSTGIIWFYWDYFKDLKTIKQTESLNMNDFGGNEICDLFVHKKYENYKMELLQYISIKEYTELVLHKAMQYLESEKVTGMKPNQLCQYTSNYCIHYGINKDECPKLQHIIAIIMYCDFTDFCTIFSATFRAMEAFESLLSIKQRNSAFYCQSKALREMVECYGAYGDYWDDKTDEYKPYDSGPFFCGMGIVMTMPQFSVRICSPTSTSRHIEVSMRFAKRGGLIIQLNNTGHLYAVYIPLFDCSWLSKYSEESEVLIFGGFSPIRIMGIRIIETANNYESLFHSLFIFDMLLNGQGWRSKMKDMKVMRSDISLLNELIKHSLSDTLDTTNIDEYIVSTFKLFIYQKTQISINLDLINEYFKQLSHLFTESDLKKTSFEEIERVLVSLETDRSNIISPNILNLFKNIKTITICTTEGGGYRSYPFNLMYFLETIQSSLSWTQITIEAGIRKQEKSWDNKEDQLKYEYKNTWDRDGYEYRFCESWLSLLWQSSETQSKYNQNGIKTRFRKENVTNEANGIADDCLIICRDNNKINQSQKH
eukprot:437281_1